MKKIYLGNTLIHDEKEYNEMKESINTLKDNLEGISAPTVWTYTIGDNGNIVPGEDNPFDTDKLKDGDLLISNNGTAYKILLAYNRNNGMLEPPLFPDSYRRIAAIVADVDGYIYSLDTTGDLGFLATADGEINATTLAGMKAYTDVLPGSKSIPVKNEEGGLIFVDTVQKINLRTLTTQGWYRVYQSTQGHNVGQSIKLNINTAYNLHRSCSYTFEINLSYDNVSINQFASINTTSNMIDKIRVLRKDHDKVYVDVHYAYNENNNVYLNIQGIGTVQFLEGPTIPDDYISTEFSTTDGFKSQINDVETSFSRTINGNIKVSENGNSPMTTDQFLTKLNEFGAFSINKHTTFICEHSYASNDYIETSVGNISLSGSIINIYCNSYNPNIASGWALYQIDITTATVNNNVPNTYNNAVFRLTKTATNAYIWSRLVNANELPLRGVNNNITNFTSIPIDKKVVYGTFSSDVVLDLAGNVIVGDNMVVLMKNSSTANKTISLTNYPNRNVDTLTVPAGELAEINFLAIGTQISDYYVRGILYKD